MSGSAQLESGSDIGVVSGEDVSVSAAGDVKGYASGAMEVGASSAVGRVSGDVSGRVGGAGRGTKPEKPVDGIGAAAGAITPGGARRQPASRGETRRRQAQRAGHP